MYWLIQSKFTKDPKLKELVANLERMEVNHSFCWVVPFSEDGLNSDIDLDSIDEPIFCYGSYTLSKIAVKKGYRPGAYISPMISLNNLLDHYGDEMLNNDMEFYALKDVLDNVPDTFFARPMEDSKSFTAEVTTKKEFGKFVKGIENIGKKFSTVTMETMVAVSKPKPIQREIRFFIVDGKISTYSSYKIGDYVNYDQFVDQYIIDYVENIIDIWGPDRAYCLDIAISDGQPKILEVNSINSSGLYAIDTQKFIQSINELDRVLV